MEKYAENIRPLRAARWLWSIAAASAFNFAWRCKTRHQFIHHGRKHANLLGRLGPIFLVVLAENDGFPSHVCRSCKHRAFTVEKKLYCHQLFILEHHFRFPYLTEGVRHSLSKPTFPGTDCHRSQPGRNNQCVSIMYGHETWTRLL